MSASCFSWCHFLHAVFMDTSSLHNNDHDVDDRHHLGSNINYQGPCGSSSNPQGNPENSVPIFPLHGWRNWGSMNVEECEQWLGGWSPFSRGSAFWHNSLSSYSWLPRIYGSYIIWFIYREIFYRDFPGLYSLGLILKKQRLRVKTHIREKEKGKKK